MLGPARTKLTWLLAHLVGGVFVCVCVSHLWLSQALVDRVTHTHNVHTHWRSGIFLSKRNCSPTGSSTGAIAENANISTWDGKSNQSTRKPTRICDRQQIFCIRNYVDCFSCASRVHAFDTQICDGFLFILRHFIMCQHEQSNAYVCTMCSVTSLAWKTWHIKRTLSAIHLKWLNKSLAEVIRMKTAQNRMHHLSMG